MLKYFKNISFSQLTLSARGFLLYSPISILGYLVPVKVVNNNISNLTSLYFGTALTLTIFIAYLITLKIWNRFVSAPQIILFFLLPVVLGAIRGLIFYYLVEYQQLNQPSP